MKKYRIKSPVRFTVFLTALIMCTVFVFSAVLGINEASGMDKESYVTVKVQYGDTLWQLAKDYGSDNQDIRQTVYEICSLNNIKASDLYAGMYITIPQ